MMNFCNTVKNFRGQDAKNVMTDMMSPLCLAVYQLVYLSVSQSVSQSACQPFSRQLIIQFIYVLNDQLADWLREL